MADETVRMAVRAHPRLRDELLHARWLGGRRLEVSGCGCLADDGDVEGQSQDEAVGHRVVILPGPDTRSGGPGGAQTPTVLACCRCGWERRGADEAWLRNLWRDHVMGEEEPPAYAR